MILILISVLIALVFYLILPIIGCVISSHKWNQILEAIVSSRFSPIFTKKTSFSEICKTPENPATSETSENRENPETITNPENSATSENPENSETSEKAESVHVRYFGKIEHIPENSPDEEFFYFFDGKRNFKLKKKDTVCYLLKENKKNNYSSHQLESVCWADFIACSKGTDLFITGNLEKSDKTEKNMYSFTKTDKNKIILVFYEGSQKDFWTNILHSSPKKSPWKNPFSLISLVVGFFAILALVLPLFAKNFPPEYGYWGYTLLILPLLTFFPPGLLLFFVFVSYFKKGSNYIHYSKLIENQVYGLSVFNRVLKLPDNTEYELKSVEKTKIPPLEIPKNIKRDLLLHEKEDWFACGLKPKDDYSELDIPNDPFFDRFSMPASPLHLIDVCKRKSVACKILSGCFLTVDVFCNFFLFFRFLLLLSIE